MIKDILDWFKSLSSSDWILVATFLAIVWYTLETRQLRKWQKLQTLLSVFFEQTKDWDSAMKARTQYPNKFREIVETGRYDPKWAYSPAYHHPITWKGKLLQKIKSLFVNQ